MLYDVDRMANVTTIPHREIYNMFRHRMSQEEYDSIEKALNDLIDNGLKNSKEIQTASWMTEIESQPAIYELLNRVCGNSVQFRYFFGITVWVVFMKRNDWWSFGEYPKRENDIVGKTYFTIDDPT
jgi:hypothetical protein